MDEKRFKHTGNQAVHLLMELMHEKAPVEESEKQEKQKTEKVQKGTVAKNENGFKQASVRFTVDEWNEIRKASNELGVSMAEVIRLAVSGQLTEYKTKVNFVDVKQGMEVARKVNELKKVICKMYEELNGVRTELNRIGVNYNQEIRLMQIQKKFANTKDAKEKLRLRKEEKDVRNESRLNVSKGEIDMWIGRLESAFKEAGETLCHILQ